jgi:protein-S-isoprenylcysteine O-methyltransferase Ste14
MRVRRLIFFVNYFVLIVACGYSFNSPIAGIWLDFFIYNLNQSLAGTLLGFFIYNLYSPIARIGLSFFIYSLNQPLAGTLLGQAIVIFGVSLSLVCLALMIIIHRRFPKKHEKASDFAELMTTGPYSHVRHPLYSVVIVLNYAFSLIFLSIYGVVASTLLISLIWYLAKTEEADLVRFWGQEYIEYKKKVPMFIPIRFRKK